MPQADISYNWGPITLDDESFDDLLDAINKEDLALEASYNSADLINLYRKQVENNNELCRG